MKTIIKYLIFGILIAFLALLLTAQNTALMGAAIIFTVIICTGIIVSHIRKLYEPEEDDASNWEDDSNA